MATRREAVGGMAVGILVMSGMINSGAEQGGSEGEARSAFWPTVTSTMRPWTRWWWLGNAVDKQNLTHLLETYRQAGIGGVEVTSIYGVNGQDAREIAYLSPEWLAMLTHTCTEAKRLDMGVDLPPGSGWRIGGPTVPTDLASANVVIETHAVFGGDRLHLAFSVARPQAVMAYGVDHSIVPLTDRVAADGTLDWLAPPGDWTVYTVSQRFSGSKVKRPGPGGAGNSINPFSQRSLDAALKPFGDAIDQVPPGAIRAQFHNSYEYEGNWTDTLFSEFRARCGYDLQDHLPALVGKGEPDEGERVRNDYRKVIGDLHLDRVVTPWVEQAHRHGQLAREQAHGSPGNLLDLYATADIPETEVFGADRAPLMNMFASSAAHVAGRPLVSSETATWIAEHFTETLAEVKAECDMLFCAGINHIVYQGTAYSPSDAPWPGWLFYASLEMNPSNPIWRDIPTLNAYITRCQSLLQSGKPDNDILLYWPERDVWQGDAKPFIRQLTVHKRDWFEKEPFGQLAQTLLQQGYTLDYVSDRQLAQAHLDTASEIRLPGGRYTVIMVPYCRFMPLDTLLHLKDLAEAGATVMFHNDFPTDVPGWADLEQRRQRFRAVVAAFQPQSNPATDAFGDHLRGFRVGQGTVWIGNDFPRLMEQAPARRERLVETPGLTFVRRTDSVGAFYFLVNRGTTTIDRWIPFISLAEHALLLDPMTGQAGLAKTRTRAKAATEAYIQLAPSQSLFLRSVEPPENPIPAWNYWEIVGTKLVLPGVWHVQFIEGGPENPPSFETTKLASWTRLGGDQAERFAGTARYTLHFGWAEKSMSALLNLGTVCQSARVRLNGQPLGTLLHAPYQVLAEHLKAEDNVLEIEVTSVAANRIRDLDRRGAAWKIFKDINFVNIDYKRFDAAAWPLTDCGLLGPVTLQSVEAKHP